MDKKLRNRLSVEEEETHKKIDLLILELIEAGKILEQLSTALRLEPEKVIFFDAPAPLDPLIVDPSTQYNFDWKRLPNFVHIAHVIQDLRNENNKLLEIKQNLRSISF